MANRDELRNPCLVLLLQDFHGIGSCRRRLPFAVCAPRDLGSFGLAARGPLGRAGMRLPAIVGVSAAHGAPFRVYTGDTRPADSRCRGGSATSVDGVTTGHAASCRRLGGPSW